MAKVYDIRSIAPEALVAAGVVDWRGGDRPAGGRVAIELPEPGQPQRWQWPQDRLARLAGDAALQARLSRAWVRAADGGAEPVRLALYGVPDRSRHALITRLGRARPAPGAVFVADDTLEPEPHWQWPLRVGAVTAASAGELFEVLEGDAVLAPVVDTYVLGEQDGDCDVLAVSSAAELDAVASGGGLSAGCLAWFAPRPPAPYRLARLDAAARNLDASGWVVADVSATDAGDWLGGLVRNLSENRALDEAADRAGSWLTVAHPGLAGRHAVVDGVRAAAAAVREFTPDAAQPPTVALGDRAMARLRFHLCARPLPVTEVTTRVLVEATDVRFDGTRLGGGVADAVREVRRAGAAPGPSNSRYLQALVSDRETGDRRLHAFRCGAVNEVHLRVGPHSPEWHRLAASFPEQALEFKGGAARLTVTFEEERDDASFHEPVKVFLPARGASSEAVFPVDVGAREREVRCTARVYYRKRQLQRLVIGGPVSASDDAVDGQEIAVNGEAFDSLAEPPEQREETGAARSETVRIENDSELVVGVGEGSRVRIPDLEEFRARIRTLLGDSVNEDAVATGPDFPAPAELLCGLAQQGSALYDQLEKRGFGGLKDAVSLQLVSAETAELWPLEFVYDYGYPADTAELCAGWQRALQTGTCGCRRRTRSSDRGRRTVCPLGFWGLRMVIERRVERDTLDRTVVEQAPQGARSTLRPVDSALFAASGIVHKPDLDQVVTILLDSLGASALHRAENWTGWRKVVRAEGPPLLLAVPHNDRDRGGTPVLVIGRGSTLPSLRIDRRHIVSDLHPDGVGPVVMLLGCNTAQEDISWQNVAARFLEKSAPVVVGTLVPTLGRQATVMAGIAGRMLAGNDREDLSVGELVRDIRRQLLLRGCTLAMAVVAFGDARWLVGSRTPVPGTGPGGGS